MGNIIPTFSIEDQELLTVYARAAGALSVFDAQRWMIKAINTSKTMHSAMDTIDTIARKVRYNECA